MEMSSNKQKQLVFPSNYVTSCNSRKQPQEKQQNDHRPTEEIQSASSDSMPEIVMNCQPHQPPKTFKFPETVYGKQKHLQHCEYFLRRKSKKAFNFRPVLNLKKDLIS